MSNTRRAHDSRKRTGLVEITTEPGKVILQLFPPGAAAVVVPMTPEQARGLGQGLMDGAGEAEGVIIVRPEDVNRDPLA